MVRISKTAPIGRFFVGIYDKAHSKIDAKEKQKSKNTISQAILSKYCKMSGLEC